ncbi:FkbM family methyltransferase [Aeromicrobium stalagmiti]|uniref:FkbM family methyltransferase n=1 Tax=Aeromicrobium stalagmiti TaxID=2738988 RepID=UPI001568BCDA|nr:FkbM family methyltransferase [Aeromicrobium stalagmiti]NRQ49349.1 FkbM family methyltransferase [Aeromicrobium stalagmiti]
MRVRRVVRAGRRIRQSFTHFDNGTELLWSTVRSKEMTFRTKTGLTMYAPNIAGARFPVYEINADDVYRMGDLLEGLRPDLTAVDIGAHIGSFSTAVCAAVPGATVHAYEASPSTAAWLERNVAANDLGDRLVVHRRAVSDHAGALEFVDNGSASAHNGLTAPDGYGATVSVPCVTFADIHAATGGRIDLIKSDAEGAEYGVILTSDPAHWTTVQRVVMEYHPVDGYSFDDLVAFLGGVGLDLVRNEPADRPGLGNAWFARAAAA